jgi:sugar phosphate isomerase/epimerase
MSAGNPGPKLGVTLYSFTPDFHAGRYAVADLIRICGGRGLGPGLEIVGFQSLRGFPNITEEQVRELRTAMDDAGLEPACLATNADIGLRSDRLLTDEELVDYLAAQIRCAQRLGFPTVRVQNNANPSVLERLLPLAEDANVVMGLEIHSASTINTPWVVAVRELIDRTESPYVGFTPDFGASTRAMSPSLLDEFRRRGASEALLASVTELWGKLRERGGNPEEAFPEFMALGTPEEKVFAEDLAVYAIGIHGQAAPESWSEIMPNTVHVHGKFFGFDEHGNEPAVPYETLLPLFVEGGYNGYISSEWEGWHWNWEPNGFDMVAKHHALCRRVLGAVDA